MAAAAGGTLNKLGFAFFIGAREATLGRLIMMLTVCWFLERSSTPPSASQPRPAAPRPRREAPQPPRHPALPPHARQPTMDTATSRGDKWCHVFPSGSHMDALLAATPEIGLRYFPCPPRQRVILDSRRQGFKALARVEAASRVQCSRVSGSITWRAVSRQTLAWREIRVQYLPRHRNTIQLKRRGFKLCAEGSMT